MPMVRFSTEFCVARDFSVAKVTYLFEVNGYTSKFSVVIARTFVLV